MIYIYIMDEAKYLKYKAKYLALKEKQEGGAFYDVDLGFVYVFANEALLEEIHKIHKEGENKVKISGVVDASLNFNNIMGIPGMINAYYVSTKYPEQIRPCQTSFARKTTTFFSRSTLSEPGKTDIKVSGLEQSMNDKIKKMSISDLSRMESDMIQYLSKVKQTLNNNNKCFDCNYIVMFNVGKNENITIEYIYDNLAIMEKENWLKKGKYTSLKSQAKEAVSKAATTAKEAVKSAATSTKKAASKVGTAITSVTESAHEKMCKSYVKKIKELEAKIKLLERK